MTKEPDPSRQFWQGMAIALIGCAIMFWGNWYMIPNQKKSTAGTVGVGFVGMSVALFGLYQAEFWKKAYRQMRAKAKQRKENAG